MSGLEMLELKQRLVALTEEERREISLFLYKLKTDTDDWKQETARRIDEMDRGKKYSLEEVRRMVEN